MYPSRGNNSYGQQSYGGQSAYGQNLGTGYSGNSVGGPDGGSQLPMGSRHSSMLGGSEDVDANAYRPLPAAHYGGQYSSLYGSVALSTATQVPSMGGSGQSVLESRGGYVPAKPNSPKFSSGDYMSTSNHAYGHKGDQLYGEMVDYPGVDRRQFGERQSAYIGRDMQIETTGRYADVGFGQHQSEIYDRIDKAVLLRQEQLLKSQSLQSASLEGSARQVDYLAGRGAASRHPTQDLTSFGGRMDADPRSLSMLSGSSYGGQPAPSILGAAPRRSVDDLMFSQSSSNPGYGVSLPPGRDYATGKGLRGPSLESDYPSSLSHGGHPRIDERKDDRASYLQEFELREEARRRERLRERDRDREKDRERERERERERDRILERRGKERERERKRPIEIRRERTPPRVSRDRGASSLAKEGRIVRRESPQASHRRLSPIKDKRRDYVCKVYSTSLVDAERDYLSLDKRYPRLFIPSEVSKAVVNWPREKLQLSIHTPVSFEHDFGEEESAAELKEPATDMLVEEPVKFGPGNTVWNAKFILMSGLSKNALEDLSSERGSDDRMPHFCNILRFAFLKRDRSYMAIGGPWSPVDGGDPSFDDSSLIQTALRYGKDVAKLDLQNCKHWNRFLEIHYDRIGKDGLFSHKEVTVLYVPDLSECIPSLDSWRDQWLAHKKVVAERERLLSLKKERSREKEGMKDKETESSKHKRVDKEDKKKESGLTGDAKGGKKTEQDGSNSKGNASEGKGEVYNKKHEKKDETVEEKGKIEDEKDQVETPEVQTTGTVKTGKKKIIKKVVRPKVVGKSASDSTTKQPEKAGDGNAKGNSETSGQEEESSADPAVVKTFVRKKVIKKVPVAKAAQNEDDMGTKVKDEKEAYAEDKSDPSGGSSTTVKTIVKKKIIKRVPKKKVTGVELNEGVSNSMKEGDQSVKNVVAEKPANEGAETEKQLISKTKASKTQGSDKKNDVASSSKADAKDGKEDKKGEKVTGEKSDSVTKVDMVPDSQKDNQKQKIPQKDNQNGSRKKLKDAEKTKDEKEKRGRDGKDESKSKSNKELKETRKPEEPPRHPGLILKTKRTKDSKLRSSSLSLDLLLDYTDKDIEESSFELSVFAETLYEMLQYQMGCRLLSFLQKLRIKFVTKRNQRKRQREVEIVEKGSDEKSAAKRPKLNELPVKNQPVKSSETLSSSQPDGEKQDEEKSIPKENDTVVDHVDEVKMEDVAEEEDPEEEDPEEYEEPDDAMQDGSPQHHSSNENNEEPKNDLKPEPESEKDELNAKEQASTKVAETNTEPEVDADERKEGKALDTGKKESPPAKEVVVDKELLQAFRFFDRNQAGYIRVEDMRLIIHNLGKFLSHRDVKELVQSALIESNTARDDHILYKKLVRMTDV